MSTMKAILDGFGTLSIDPSRRLRQVRAEMAKANAARRRSMVEQYRRERIRYQASNRTSRS